MYSSPDTVVDTVFADMTLRTPLSKQVARQVACLFASGQPRSLDHCRLAPEYCCCCVVFLIVIQVHIPALQDAHEAASGIRL